MAIELGLARADRLEGGEAHEAQVRVADGAHRGRARRAVDDGELPDQVARPEDREDPLAARSRHHIDLQQANVDEVESVAGVVGGELCLLRSEVHGAGVAEQQVGEFCRQDRQQRALGGRGDHRGPGRGHPRD
jgi:hypothetical protein